MKNGGVVDTGNRRGSDNMRKVEERGTGIV